MKVYYVKMILKKKKWLVHFSDNSEKSNISKQLAALRKNVDSDCTHCMNLLF